MPSPSSHNKATPLLLIGILLIALNLRPALASLGPLVDDVRDTTGLSNFMLGLLTTLPLMAFSLVSISAAFFTKMLGIGRVLFLALLLLTLGILIRSLNSVPALYIGTLMLGIAIAFGNVLLPSLTKQNYPDRAGLITSLYSSMMGIGAALAAGISVPLARDFKLEWQGSLRVWAWVSLAALIVWIPQLWRLKKIKSKRNPLQAIKNMLGQRLAWQVAMFMGLQSFTFYVVLAWLPDLLITRSYDAETAGWMLSLSQATGILGSMSIPFIAGRRANQRSLVVFLVVIEVISLIGLIFPVFGPTWLWISAIGFVLGGCFGLALLFLVLRASDTQTATELSGMAQSVGYFIAAIGPIFIGSLFDFTQNWNYPIIALLFIAIFKLFMGLQAGKPGKVTSL